jgi:hypothetical protein
MRAVGQEGIEPRKILELARRLQVLARNQGLEKVFRRDTWERHCHRRLCQGRAIIMAAHAGSIFGFGLL